jgi:hypothetical protein
MRSAQLPLADRCRVQASNKWVCVAVNELPVFALTSEEVGYAIEERHEVWLASQSGVVALESDGARMVGPTPAADMLVRALTASSRVTGSRPFESSGDWLPAHNAASVCSKERQVVAMRNELSPEAPVPIKHSRVGCINFLQQTPEIDVCRLHVIGEPPIQNRYGLSISHGKLQFTHAMPTQSQRNAAESLRSARPCVFGGRMRAASNQALLRADGFAGAGNSVRRRTPGRIDQSAAR